MNGTAQHDVIVEDYLQRLERAAWALSPERRAELVLEIRDHIADARTAAGQSTDEAWTRTLLDRMGSPEEIVAAASEGEPSPWGTPPPQWAAPPPMQTVEKPAGTGLELAAVLLLTIGSGLFIVGWLVGVVLLWSSRRWRTWEKVLGTLIVPGGPLGIVWVATFLPTQTCSSSQPSQAAGGVTQATTTCTGFAFQPAVGIPLFAFAFLAPLILAGWLYSRARARADLEPPTLVVVGPRRRIQDSPWGSVELAAVLLLAAGPFLLPVIGPLIGIVLVWTSQSWTTKEKVIGSAIALGGAVLPVLGVLIAR